MHVLVHAAVSAKDFIPITVDLSDKYLAKINNELWPLKIGSSDASREMIKYVQKLGPDLFFEGDMTICNHYNLLYKIV
jgi:hypothetical protein